MRKRIIAVLAVLVAMFGIGGAVGVSPASAHYGDWWTQYQSTGNFACSGLGACTYVDSAPYGDHSRRFVWSRHESTRTCYAAIYIGHTYSIWAWEWTICISN